MRRTWSQSIALVAFVEVVAVTAQNVQMGYAAVVVQTAHLVYALMEDVPCLHALMV